MKKSFLAQLERRARFNNLMAKSSDYFSVMIEPMKLPGDYFLKDGRRFTSTVFEQEKGIFIDESDKYICLDLFSSELYDEKQMKAFLSRYNVQLPSLSEITIIVDNAEIINQSLLCIGRASQALDKNTNGYWYQGYGKQASRQKRRLLVVKKEKPVPPCGLGRFEFPTVAPFSVPGIALVHNNFADPYRVLQSLGNNEYYVLDVDCKACTMRSWDRELNGSIHQEGDVLFVENPQGIFYENGERYLSIYVCRFRKITGLYAYEGHDYKSIHYSADEDD